MLHSKVRMLRIRRRGCISGWSRSTLTPFIPISSCSTTYPPRRRPSTVFADQSLPIRLCRADQLRWGREKRPSSMDCVLLPMVQLIEGMLGDFFHISWNGCMRSESITRNSCLRQRPLSRTFRVIHQSKTRRIFLTSSPNTTTFSWFGRFS